MVNGKVRDNDLKQLVKFR